MLHFFVTPFWIVCVHILVCFFIPFHFGCVFNMCVHNDKVLRKNVKIIKNFIIKKLNKK